MRTVGHSMKFLKVLTYWTEGQVWNTPSERMIFRMISRNYNQDYHLNKVSIRKLAFDITEDIRRHPGIYWDGNADSWSENNLIRAYRASTVEDLESLLSLRQVYYEHKTYLIFFAFESSQKIEDVIGIEILVLPPKDMFSSDDDEFLDVDIDDGGFSPPIEE